MTDQFLKFWKTEFELFSAAGLYSLGGGTLFLMANKGSLSSIELKDTLRIDDAILTPTSIHRWSEFWIKKNDMVFANGLFMPIATKDLILLTILKTANISLVSTQDDLNKFAKKVTYGQIKKVPMPHAPFTHALINIAMFRIKWRYVPTVTNPKTFSCEEDWKKYTIEVPYMRHRLYTKCLETSEYRACRLLLASNQMGSSAPLDTFIFSFFSMDVEREIGNMWKQIRGKLTIVDSKWMNIFFPSGLLEEKIELDGHIFSKIFRKNNPDFNPILSTKEEGVALGFGQLNKLSMDKNGAEKGSTE
ncbi:hypothetical protein HMI56_001936 [Coelomomyces lativittatus]|nr:hypothetical protein HMI56_001936 [Coelomomyces lativittatus]